MKPFDQLALAFATRADQEDCAKAMLRDFNATFPARDRVRAAGLGHFGQRIDNTAELMFDYRSWPMEYELLHYVDGWNWHQLDEGLTFRRQQWLSHYGVHVESENEIRKFRERYKVLQEVVTLEHTNEYLLEQKRHYHYVIFDAVKDLGVHLKTIRRITPLAVADWLNRL
jgi:hypothetical protein